MSAFGGKADLVFIEVSECPLLTQSGHREDGAVNRPGVLFYSNGIELPLTVELLAIFLLPIPTVLLGIDQEGRMKR